MMRSTCDWCDEHKADVSGAFRVLPPGFLAYGARRQFSGQVTTVQCFEDNTAVKSQADSPGLGRVLVVDAAASMRRAVLGGNLAAAAARNGWAGVVVNGCVRDLAELRECDLGILALGHVPMPTIKREQGLVDVVVQIQGVMVRPGDWLYADEDGVVINGHALD
jgi:regulator of ribonuclease activity A